MVEYARDRTTHLYMDKGIRILQRKNARVYEKVWKPTPSLKRPPLIVSVIFENQCVCKMNQESKMFVRKNKVGI